MDKTHQQNTGERLHFPHWVNVHERTKRHFSERGREVRGEAGEISRRFLHRYRQGTGTEETVMAGSAQASSVLWLCADRCVCAVRTRTDRLV